jgi:hemerythrin-like domain-containing protein
MTTETNDEVASLRHIKTPAADPSDVLISEHRLVERALNCLERMAERWCGPGRTEELDCQAVREAIIFFQTFVESWHFRREEAYFVAADVPLDGLETDASGDSTFHDHERCSVHLRGIEDAVGIIVANSHGEPPENPGPATVPGETLGNTAARPATLVAAYRSFGEHARAYSDVLLRHIEDEEDFIYPALERRVTPDARQAAAAAFHRASRESIDSDRLDECMTIVTGLAERFGVSAGIVR